MVLPLQSRPSIHDWVERVSVEEMPVMYRTALDIASLAADEGAPSSMLVNAILKDPGLTARVLTLANSVMHNPSAQPLSTVSRALVVLGLNTLRSICLSVTLVDSLLQGNSRDPLLAELARSFHAAVLARAMADHKGDESPEEVFVATLLFRIGELAFWCFGGSVRDALEQELQRGASTPGEAEAHTIGFRLSELSLGLAMKWKLGPLLESALRERRTDNERVKLVQLAQRYVAAATKPGDNSAEVRVQQQRLMSFLGVSQSALEKVLDACVKEAASTARICGANAAATKIIRSNAPQPEKNRLTRAAAPAFPEEPPFPQFDPLLQLRILRELTTLVSSSSDVREVIHTVLEGMYRSIGMDRAVFALVSPDRRKLIARFALGHDVSTLQEHFELPLTEHEPHVFYTALEKKTILWAKVGNPAGSPGFVQRRIRNLVGAGPFFIAAAVMGQKSIGLFYVDRRVTDRPLDEESFQSFKLFAQQANLAFDFLSRQRGVKELGSDS